MSGSITRRVIACAFWSDQSGFAAASADEAPRDLKTREIVMPITLTRFLRAVLYADIVFSTGGAVLMAAGAPCLSQLLVLPGTLLAGAGLLLVPWVAALIVVVRRKTVPKIVMIDIAGINLLWCAACFGLLAFGGITPNALGIAFVAAQALAVALLGVLQLLGLRGATAAA
jgi:hypothetical protein